MFLYFSLPFFMVEPNIHKIISIKHRMIVSLGSKSVHPPESADKMTGWTPKKISNKTCQRKGETSCKINSHLAQGVNSEP